MSLEFVSILRFGYLDLYSHAQIVNFSQENQITHQATIYNLN